MNKFHFLQKLAIAGVAGAAALAVPMKADAATLLIDNYNTDTTVQAQDCRAGVCVPTGTVGDPGFPDGGEGIRTDLPDDWQLNLRAILNTGDRIATQVCASCDNGELISDAATPISSSGIHVFDYSGNTPIDGSQFTGFMFDWILADQEGADIQVRFDGQIVASLEDLPETDTPITYNLGLSSNDTEVRLIEIAFTGVPNLDANFDNAKLTMAVPEPGTILGLLAVGGLGLGLKRKKQG